jgi:hypothetical protein
MITIIGVINAKNGNSRINLTSEKMESLAIVKNVRTHIAGLI